MPLPIVALGLGGILSTFLEFLAKVFVKSRFFRLLISLGLIEGMYLILNNSIQFFIDYLFSKIQSLSVPSEICFVLTTLDIFNLMSFYASVLISFAFAKYFLRMSERII